MILLWRENVMIYLYAHFTALFTVVFHYRYILGCWSECGRVSERSGGERGGGTIAIPKS